MCRHVKVQILTSTWRMEMVCACLLLEELKHEKEGGWVVRGLSTEVKYVVYQWASLFHTLLD